MIQAVHGGLHFQQQFGVAHVLAQSGRHRRGVLEETREDAAVRPDDRVVRVEDIKRRRAVVGIDDHFDAVTHVIDEIPVQTVVARVRVTVGDRERVHQPRQPAIVIEDDIRIGVDGEERRQRGHAIPDIAPHQQPALCGHVVAERQLREIAAVERDNHAPQNAAQHDPAIAFVRREAVGLALRVVEFFLTRFHVDVGVGQLAEIDFRALHG